MTNQEIIDFLSVNQSDRWKVAALKNISDIGIVNELLTDADLSTIIHDPNFFDDLFDSYKPFEDVLDDYFMLHLNVDENNNDVMIWLQRIYA